MNKSISISVVIPCFNHGEFVAEAAASVTNLKRDDVELIVVDDGSTDARTHLEMDLLMRQGVKVLRQQNKGLGAARNAGISIAQGEFILPLDSDNRLRSAYLDAGVELLRKNEGAGIVYSNAEYFGEKTGVWVVREFDLCQLAMMNFIDACALYRKSVWQSIQGYDEKMPWMGWEDWDFWLRAAFSNWTFLRLQEVAFDYRVRSGSMLSETDCHQDELIAYIFGKPQNQSARVLREQCIKVNAQKVELERLRMVESSRDYRLGRALLSPLRRLKKIWA